MTEQTSLKALAAKVLKRNSQRNTVLKVVEHAPEHKPSSVPGGKAVASIYRVTVDGCQFTAIDRYNVTPSEFEATLRKRFGDRLQGVTLKNEIRGSSTARMGDES